MWGRITGAFPLFVLNNKNNVVFELEIDVAENLGAETYIHAKACSRNMIIKVATADNVNTEGTIKFVMDVNKIHLFDREEQNTIF